MPHSGCSDGKSKDTSKSPIIRSGASPSESRTASSAEPRSSPISAYSTIQGTPKAIAAWLRWSSEAPRVNPSPLPAKCLERMIRESSPKSSLRPFGWWNHSTSSWRTRQPRKALRTQPTGEGFSLAWPRSATMSNGIVSERATWAPRIGAIASGFLLRFLNGKLVPTPMSKDGQGGPAGGGKGGKSRRSDLQRAVKEGMLPTTDRLLGTPTATDSNSGPNPPADDKSRLKAQVSGPLNPSLHLWLMGWPEGASDYEPLAKESFRSWLLAHGCDLPAVWQSDHSG